MIYEDGSRSHAASIGGVGLQIIREWVERFNQHGPDGLKTGKVKGREPSLNDKQRKALVEAVEKGPVSYLDGVVRWRLVDLVQWLWQERRILLSRQVLGRELQAMGYRKLTVRPKHHAQDSQSIEELGKNPPAAVADIAAGAARGKRVEIWFQCMVRLRCARKNVSPDRLCFSVSGLLMGENARAKMGAAGVRSLQDERLAFEVSSVPLSETITPGFLRHCISAVSSQATRRPEIEVSGIAARHSRVTSSTMLSTRKRLPQAN